MSDEIKSDLKRIDAMKDEDIDYSDIPMLDDSYLNKPLYSKITCNCFFCGEKWIESHDLSNYGTLKYLQMRNAKCEKCKEKDNIINVSYLDGAKDIYTVENMDGFIFFKDKDGNLKCIGTDPAFWERKKPLLQRIWQSIVKFMKDEK